MTATGGNSPFDRGVSALPSGTVTLPIIAFAVDRPAGLYYYGPAISGSPGYVGVTTGLVVIGQQEANSSGFGGIALTGSPSVGGSASWLAGGFANTNSPAILELLAGDNNGVSNPAAYVLGYRGVTFLGYSGWDGSTAVVGGVAMAIDDFKWLTSFSVHPGFIDSSNNGRLVWGIGGITTTGPITGTFTATAPLIVTGTNVNALAVGRQGITNPAFNVNTNAAVGVTGITVVAQISGSGVNITATSNAAAEDIWMDALGAGNIRLNATATGLVIISNGLWVAGAGALITGSAGVPGANAANVAGEINIAAGSNAGANDTLSVVRFYRTNVVQGLVGFDGSTAVIGGITMAVGDLKFQAPTGTYAGFVDISNSSQLVWGVGGMQTSGTVTLTNATLGLDVTAGGARVKGTGTVPAADATNANSVVYIACGNGATGQAAHVDFYRDVTLVARVGVGRDGTTLSGQTMTANGLAFYLGGSVQAFFSSGTGDLLVANGMGLTGNMTFATTNQVLPRTGVMSYSVVSTALTQGSAGSIVIPYANMSGALNDAARDVLAGNLAGCIAADSAIVGRVYVRDAAGVWHFILFV